MDIWAEFMNFLNQYSADPIAYSVVFFIFAVLATIILPIPVEIGLILNPGTPFIFKALILGAGKAVGSILVFYVGFKVEGGVRRWSERWWFAKWFVEKCTWFVEKTGHGRYDPCLCFLPLQQGRSRAEDEVLCPGQLLGRYHQSAYSICPISSVQH
jgi:hypothetical protein